MRQYTNAFLCRWHDCYLFIDINKLINYTSDKLLVEIE